MGWRAVARAWTVPASVTAALVAATAFLTLLAPRSDPGRAAAACFYLIELPRGRQLAFGCDGFTFLRGAVDPSLLFEPTFAPPADFTYQSRPLHIGLAAILGRVLQPVVARVVPADASYQGRTPIRDFAGVYAAYVLINAGLLVAAGLALHDILLGAGRAPTLPETVALLAGLAFILLSRVVKVWLFTPHTVLWGVLIPLWALAVGRRTLADPASSSRSPLLLTAGVAGLAVLAYGYAVLVPTTAATALGLRLVRAEGPRAGLRRWFGAVTPAAGLFVLPALIWVGLSYAVAGGFYHHEAVEYRQFRWLPDAIAVGPAHALAVAAERAAEWTALAVRALGVPALILATLLLVARAGGTSLRALARRQGPLPAAALTVLVLGFLFWYLNGYRPGNRLVTLASVVQAVAAAVALDLDRRADRVRWTGLLAALGLASGVWTVLGSPSF